MFKKLQFLSLLFCCCAQAMDPNNNGVPQRRPGHGNLFVNPGFDERAIFDPIRDINFENRAAQLFPAINPAIANEFGAQMQNLSHTPNGATTAVYDGNRVQYVTTIAGLSGALIRATNAVANRQQG